MSIGYLLQNTARRLPDAPAVTQGSLVCSWAELDGRADAIGHVLWEGGLRKGDRVCLYLQNSPAFLESLFGALKAGLCVVPLNRKSTDAEILYHVGDSGSAALITDATGTTVIDLLNGTRQALDESMQEFAGNGPIDVDVAGTDNAWLFYTSGTTGRPKGATLTHANLSFVVASWLADMTPMSDEAVTMHAAPLSHGAGFHALAAVARGAHQVMLPTGQFEPSSVLDFMRRHKVTNSWMVPTQVIMLVDWLADREAKLPDLTHLVYGGAPFPLHELKRAVDCFGDRLVHLYAQGETPMTITYLSGRDHVRAIESEPELLASAGYARPGVDIAVVNAEGTALGADEVGEVVVRSPAVMSGYWNRPDATSETLSGGWLHTGDLGRINSRGYLFLVDRARDLIITGGSNVYPAEVESVLLDLPEIRAAAVVGIPDRVWGETVAAVLVPAQRQDVVLDLDLVREHCELHLAPYKRPRQFLIIDDLPRNAYGKVPKADLRGLFAQSASTTVPIDADEDAQR